MFTMVNADGNVISSKEDDAFDKVSQVKALDLKAYGVPVSSRYGKTHEIIAILESLDRLAHKFPYLMRDIEESSCDSQCGIYNVALKDECLIGAKSKDGSETDDVLSNHIFTSISENIAEAFFGSDDVSMIHVQCGTYSYSDTRDYETEDS